jgi:hypothetical protein
MLRRAFAGSRLVVAATLVLALIFSCKTFDLPAETCNPSSLNAQQSGDCGRCLEDHCCDAVGVCERTDGCADIVRRTQACVLAAGLNGASSERSCAATSELTLKNGAALAHPEADGAYRCMRSGCGAQCGLPVCQVDQAARLIRNASCDECFAGACCTQLNRCYANRACKLTLECIITGCGSALGPALRDPAAAVPAGALGDPGAIDALCKDPPPETGFPACVRKCLCQYRGNDLGLPPSGDSLSPPNLAASVYSCGRDARCGDACLAGPDDASAE